MKRLFCMSIAAFLILIFTPSVFAAEEQPEKKLTLMIYMCGSDLENGHGAASDDIEEILQSEYNQDEINILFMTGGSSVWRDYVAFSGVTAISDVTPGYTLRTVWSTAGESTAAGSWNMGDSETLATFLNYGMENYPAENYALILWDHGGGPLEGVCFDETDNMDSLSLSELQTALDYSLNGRRLSWIGMDACLMAGIETALICSPYADYLIASQETEPAFGWDYSFLQDVTGQLPPGRIPEMIVDSYISQDEPQLLLTLSSIDLTKIDTIKQATDEMFSALENQLTAESFSMISDERRDSKSFGRASTLSDYDLVDFYNLSQQLESMVPSETAALQVAIKDAVYNGSNQQNANGLSLYSPFYNKSSFSDRWHSEYKALNISSSYSSYLDHYSRIWLADQLGDWAKLVYSAAPFNRTTDSQLVECELTENQAEHFSSAKVVILQNTGGENTYKKVFESEDLGLDSNRLTYEYDFRMLYALDSRSQPLTGALAFQTVDGYYILTPMLENMPNYAATGAALDALKENESDFSPPQLIATSILRCHHSESGDDLIVDSYALPSTVSITDISDEEIMLARELESIDTAVFQYLDFEKQNVYGILEKDEDGKTLPFSAWPRTTYHEQFPVYINAEGRVTQYQNPNDLLLMTLDGSAREFGTVDLCEPWSLKFIKSAESERTGLYAQFIITDSQGNHIASDLIPLNQDNIEFTGNLNEVIYSDMDKGYSFSLASLDTVGTENGTELTFTFTGIFPSQNNCILPIIDSVEFDGINLGSLLGPAGLQYDTSGAEGVIRTYKDTINSLENLTLNDSSPHQIHFSGSIYSLVHYDPDNPFKSRMNIECAIDHTLKINPGSSGIRAELFQTETAPALKAGIGILTQPVGTSAQAGLGMDSPTVLFSVTAYGPQPSFVWQRYDDRYSEWMNIPLDREGVNNIYGFSVRSNAGTGTSELLANGLTEAAYGVYRCQVTAGTEVICTDSVSLLKDPAAGTEVPAPDQQPAQNSNLNVSTAQTSDQAMTNDSSGVWWTTANDLLGNWWLTTVASGGKEYSSEELGLTGVICFTNDEAIYFLKNSAGITYDSGTWIYNDRWATIQCKDKDPELLFITDEGLTETQMGMDVLFVKDTTGERSVAAAFGLTDDSTGSSANINPPSNQSAGLSQSTVSPGDYVTFGSYEQDNNTLNGKEPIEWLVLGVQGGKALLLSRYALDQARYHAQKADVTWETCTLRTWLNGEFLYNAFSSAEQQCIVLTNVPAQRNPDSEAYPGKGTTDKVFLLSISEVEQYINTKESRLCLPTEYAKANGVQTKYQGGNGNCVWWTRSPGKYNTGASYVSYTGSIISSNEDNVNYEINAVRPALWVDLCLTGNLNASGQESAAPAAGSTGAIFCPECGQKIAVGSKFCMYCGHAIPAM